MNKQRFTLVITSLMLAGYLISAQAAHAFSWASLFGLGQVKGEQTSWQEEAKKIVRGVRNSVAGRTSTSSTASEARTGQEGEGLIPETRINELVTAGKLTSTQGNELITKMRAIKTIRDELLVLEKDLKSYIQTNKLETSMFAGQGNQRSSSSRSSTR